LYQLMITRFVVSVAISTRPIDRIGKIWRLRHLPTISTVVGPTVPVSMAAVFVSRSWRRRGSLGKNLKCADRECDLGAAGTAQSTDTDLCHFKVKFIALVTIHSTPPLADQNFARQVMTRGIFAERPELPGGG
jgi:hypothetical protein